MPLDSGSRWPSRCRRQAPALAQGNGLHRVDSERIRPSIDAHRLVDLTAAHHDLHLVPQTSLKDRVDRLLHRIESEREKPGQPDNVRFKGFDLIDKHLHWNVDADVFHFEAVDIEHEAHDVFADVVQVTVYRAD